MDFATIKQDVEKDITTIKNDAIKALAWVGLNEQTVIGFFKPILLEVGTILTDEVIPKIEAIIPDVAKAWLAGGYKNAIAQTVVLLTPILKAAGIELEEDVEASIQTTIVARAKASVLGSVTPAQAAVAAIPSAAVIAASVPAPAGTPAGLVS